MYALTKCTTFIIKFCLDDGLLDQKHATKLCVIDCIAHLRYQCHSNSVTTQNL